MCSERRSHGRAINTTVLDRHPRASAGTADDDRHRIDRDKRAELESRAVRLRMFLVGTIRVVRRIDDVIELIAIDRKSAQVSLEWAFAVPPLARVILDALFSTTFVLEDPGVRLTLYWQIRSTSAGTRASSSASRRRCWCRSCRCTRWM
jgi:hypothetical protein